VAEIFAIGERVIPAGRTTYLDLPVARLVTGDWLSLPVAAIRGRVSGPRLALSAAIHGDELNGMEIIRRVLQEIDPRKLHGTLVAVPVVNVFGFIERARYLPDRRDLNRSFPGSARGSLASRLAHLFMNEVVGKCEYLLDFHTGSLHRTNLPQIRADLDDPETRRLAEAFGAPFCYRAPTIPGSLRGVASKAGIHTLVFEGGEPLRLEESVIAAGLEGALRILDALGMYALPERQPVPATFEAKGTRWIRAHRSGIFRRRIELGQRVESGTLLGEIYSDFFSSKSRAVKASAAGLVIGYTNIPLVNQGDALVHLAHSEKKKPSKKKAEKADD